MRVFVCVRVCSCACMCVCAGVYVGVCVRSLECMLDVVLRINLVVACGENPSSSLGCSMIVTHTMIIGEQLENRIRIMICCQCFIAASASYDFVNTYHDLLPVLHIIF